MHRGVMFIVQTKWLYTVRIFKYQFIHGNANHFVLLAKLYGNLYRK